MLVCAECGCTDDDECAYNCLYDDLPCADCLDAAFATCCPAEDRAITACIRANRCRDDACVERSCRAEIDAFDTCLSTATSGGDARCDAALTQCVGSATCR